MVYKVDFRCTIEVLLINRVQNHAQGYWSCVIGVVIEPSRQHVSLLREEQ